MVYVTPNQRSLAQHSPHLIIRQLVDPKEIEKDQEMGLESGKNIYRKKLGRNHEHIIKGSRCAQLLSRLQLFETPWTVAHQSPPSMGFSRQGYWNGLPLLPPLPDRRIEPVSSVPPVLAGKSFTTEPPGKPHNTGDRVDLRTDAYSFELTVINLTA